MSEIWNSWNVKSPPVCTVKTQLHIKEIKHLREIVYNAIKTLTDSNVLNKEAAILSRFLYKNKRIFRHDKGMQNLVKVNQCLRRYLRLNMCGQLSTFMQSLPHKFSETATHAYLPTKGMLKWVLLRLQAFSQIFVRVIKLTKEAGAWFYQKMCLGWSLNLTLLVFSMTARILVSSKFLVAKSIEWYSSLYKCLPFLRETVPFLPDHTFPADLKKWLGPLDLTPLQKNDVIDKIFDIIDLSKDDEDDEDEVKIVNKKFIFAAFKKHFVKDRDIEEVTVVEEEENRKGVKRLWNPTHEEDEGVPVRDEDEEIRNVPRKKRQKSFKVN